MKLSVVIITKNEAHIIGKTLAALSGLTDDIIVVDSGSTDDTINICRSAGVKIIQTTWEGYGINKNKGNDAARYDWVLSLDADEVVDEELKRSIAALPEQEANTVYTIAYKNYFCNKRIRYGVWRNDRHARLFNRNYVSWNTTEVHEKLILPQQEKALPLAGYVQHYTVDSIPDYIHKTMLYAKAGAKQYFLKKKKASFVKLYIAPTFSFIHAYILRFGFLDGWEGFLICKTYAWYSFIKYVFLRELYKQDKQ
ncbi:MAG: glycosyltransferase family 2 protein [Bacteroidetes bacterium]|nr:glycosyltransferase family 2 protein [Bacteroidota bacterium]